MGRKKKVIEEPTEATPVVEKKKGNITVTVTFSIPKENADTINQYIDIHVKNVTGYQLKETVTNGKAKSMKWEEVTESGVAEIDRAVKQLYMVYGLKNLTIMTQVIGED